MTASFSSRALARASLLFSLFCSAALHTASGSLTAGVGTFQRPAPKLSRALLGIGGSTASARVCDGVAGFDGSELPFSAEFGSTYNLLSSPDYQLNARFADEAHETLGCALIGAIALKHGGQRVEAWPDLEVEGGILVQVDGGELLHLPRDAMGLGGYAYYAQEEGELDLPPAKLYWADEQRSLAVGGADAGEQQESGWLSGGYVDLALGGGGGAIGLAVSSTQRQDAEGTWTVTVLLATPSFTFMLVRGPAADGGLEVSIQVEDDPLLLGSMHGLVGQSVLWGPPPGSDAFVRAAAAETVAGGGASGGSNMQGLDEDYRVTSLLADDFAFNRFEGAAAGSWGGGPAWGAASAEVQWEQQAVAAWPAAEEAEDAEEELVARAQYARDQLSQDVVFVSELLVGENTIVGREAVGPVEQEEDVWDEPAAASSSSEEAAVAPPVDVQ